MEFQESSAYRVPMSNLSRDAKDGEKTITSVRPEEFSIRLRQDGEEEGIPAVVQNSVFLGVTTHYFLQTKSGREIEVIQSSDETDIIPSGAQVLLKVEPGRINVFTEEGERSLIQEQASGSGSGKEGKM